MFLSRDDGHEVGILADAQGVGHPIPIGVGIAVVVAGRLPIKQQDGLEGLRGILGWRNGRDEREGRGRQIVSLVLVHDRALRR